MGLAIRGDGPRESLALAPGDHLVLAVARAAVFYLHADQRAARGVIGDDINLAPPTVPLPVPNIIPTSAEKLNRLRLPGIAQLFWLIHKIPSDSDGEGHD